MNKINRVASHDAPYRLRTFKNNWLATQMCIGFKKQQPKFTAYVFVGLLDLLKAIFLKAIDKAILPGCKGKSKKHFAF